LNRIELNGKLDILLLNINLVLTEIIDFQ